MSAVNNTLHSYFIIQVLCTVSVCQEMEYKKKQTNLNQVLLI